MKYLYQIYPDISKGVKLIVLIFFFIGASATKRFARSRISRYDTRDAMGKGLRMFYLIWIKSHFCGTRFNSFNGCTIVDIYFEIFNLNFEIFCLLLHCSQIKINFNIPNSVWNKIRILSKIRLEFYLYINKIRILAEIRLEFCLK